MRPDSEAPMNVFFHSLYVLVPGTLNSGGKEEKMSMVLLSEEIKQQRRSSHLSHPDWRKLKESRWERPDAFTAGAT